jgi:hypothetical protein
MQSDLSMMKQLMHDKVTNLKKMLLTHDRLDCAMHSNRPFSDNHKSDKSDNLIKLVMNFERPADDLRKLQ